MNRFPRVSAAALGAIFAASASLPGAGPAVAADLETLRAEAQAVADEVTALEYRLKGLRNRAAQLERRIEETTEQLGVAELKVDDANAALAGAEDVYVTRAIAAYKRDPSFELDLMLSSHNLADLYAAVQAAGEIAKDDSDALEALVAAKAEADGSEQTLADRRQLLVAARSEADEVAQDTASALSSRRRRLSALTADITRLEEQARRAAKQAEQAARRASTPEVPDSFLELLSPSGPSDGIPKGFASTGVSFEGIASWYGPGFEGNLTASGDVFDSSLFTAASLELPLGTWLYVEHQRRGVVVLVNDRGPYIDGRILDLSQGAAEEIGITGLGWIRAEILIKD
ncbi:MAG: septal ring lytic transglycosylase RlpA family protein [Actinobacteria bacterium]|nr:septal ring lytic transglycosylase RlpA family protein [Actinomycetota bacterium]